MDRLMTDKANWSFKSDMILWTYQVLCIQFILELALNILGQLGVWKLTNLSTLLSHVEVPR